jgi:hypothetical protein
MGNAGNIHYLLPLFALDCSTTRGHGHGQAQVEKESSAQPNAIQPEAKRQLW